MEPYIAEGKCREHWREILGAWSNTQDQFASEMGRAAASYDELAATSVLGSAVWRSGRAAMCEPFAWKGDDQKQYLGRTDLWFCAEKGVHEWVEAKTVWVNWKGKEQTDILDEHNKDHLGAAIEAARFDARRNVPDMYGDNEPYKAIATAIVFFTVFASENEWSEIYDQGDEVFQTLRQNFEPALLGLHRLSLEQCAFESSEDRWPCLSFLLGVTDP